MIATVGSDAKYPEKTAATAGLYTSTFTSALGPGKSCDSVKQKIKRKLTARVLPMTRNNEAVRLQTGAALGKGGLRQAVNHSARSMAVHGAPVVSEAPWSHLRCSSEFSTVTIKKEASPAPCKHSFTDVSTTPTHRTALQAPPVKRPKFSNTDQLLQDSCQQTPVSPEPRLMSDNIATMSLLSATECHLATLQDEDGDTPLHIAIAHGNIPLIELLIQLVSCLSLDIYNNLKQTPLHLAVITRNPLVVRKLVSARANVNLPDRKGQTPAHLACQRAQEQCLGELMRARTQLHLEAKNFEGFTPLHVAVFSGDVDTVRFLIKAGADINCKDGKSGRTPLHHAVENGNKVMAQELVRLGANVNAASLSGNTALHTASGRGMGQITRILLSAGADVTVHNSQHDSAVTVANSKELALTLKRAHGTRFKKSTKAVMVKYP